MAKRIVWTKNAHSERKEILLYWKTHNQSSSYSRKLNELFKKAVKLVGAHPKIGRKTDIKNVRVKLVRDYLLFYEEGEDELSSFLFGIIDVILMKLLIKKETGKEFPVVNY